MKHKNSSGEINPWTHRQRQTSIYLAHSPIRQTEAQVSPLVIHQSNALRQNNANQMRRNKIHTDLDCKMPQRQSREIDYIIRAKENIKYEQIIPSYKTIRFQNSKPRYKSRSNSRNKDKYTTINNFYSKQHKVSDIPAQEKEERVFDKVKGRRCYTGQREEELVRISIVANKQPDLARISKTQCAKKCQFNIKLIKTKGIGVTEEVIRRGQLYDKVQSMLDNSTKSGGHLSQMKRNFIIKKLLKVIKEDQP